MEQEKLQRMTEFNKNMIEEVARWRERFEEERQRDKDKDVSKDTAKEKDTNRAEKDPENLLELKVQ